MSIKAMEDRIRDMPWPRDLLIDYFDGLAVYDARDQLILFTRRYKDLWFHLGDIVRPGMAYQSLLDQAVREGLLEGPSNLPWSFGDPPTDQISDDIHHFSSGRVIRERSFPLSDGQRLSVCTDITGVMEREEARRLRNEAGTASLLASAVTNFAQGVGIFDAKKQLVTWNRRACELLNLPYYAIRRGMSVYDVVRMAQRVRLRRLHRSGLMPMSWLRNDGPRPPIEVDLFFPGNTVVKADFRSMPNRGFVVTLTDVTGERQAGLELAKSRELLVEEAQRRNRELKNLRQQFEKEAQKRQQAAEQLELARTEAVAANLSKTRFLAAASHDILQPLNAARLFMSSLEAEQASMTPTLREITSGLAGALGSVENMLEGLFEISKLDSGGVQPKPIEFPLQQLFDRLEQSVAETARVKGIKLTVKATNAWVRTDPHLLQRILMNLLNNAVKYTMAGRVLLGVRREGSNWRVEVWDTGPGIPVEEQLSIFEEFQRGKSYRRDASGAGLGLAIVHRAASVLEHAVSLDSKVDSGTVFRVSIPSARARNIAPIATIQDQHVSLTNWSNRLVLLLENDKDVVAGMQLLFKRWGCPLLVASSYEEMAEKLEDEDALPDLAIVDYHLDTAIDGVTAIELLREDYRELATCLLTADRSEETFELAKQQGIDLFTKPIKPGELRAFLEYSFGQFC